MLLELSSILEEIHMIILMTTLLMYNQTQIQMQMFESFITHNTLIIRILSSVQEETYIIFLRTTLFVCNQTRIKQQKGWLVLWHVNSCCVI